MKLRKLFAAAFTLAVSGSLSAGVFAETSSGYRATAGTIEDDAYCFLNVLDWHRVELNNFAIFGNLGTDATGNFSFMKSIGDYGDKVLGFAWDGNTWSANHKNTWSVFYGFDKMAFKFSLTEAKTDQSIPFFRATDSLSTTQCTPDLEYGFNINDRWGITAEFAIPIIHENKYTMNNASNVSVYGDMNFVTPTFAVKGVYKVLDKDELTGKIDFGYKGAFTTATYNAEQEYKYTDAINTLSAQYRMEWKLLDTLTYGLKAYVPFEIHGKSKNEYNGGYTEGVISTVFAPVLGNGLQFYITPEKFAVNAGIQTVLPSVTCTDTENEKNWTVGEFSNIYTIGFTGKIKDSITIDGLIVLNKSSGTDNKVSDSLEDFWKSKLYLSVTAKF